MFPEVMHYDGGCRQVTAKRMFLELCSLPPGKHVFCGSRFQLASGCNIVSVARNRFLGQIRFPVISDSRTEARLHPDVILRCQLTVCVRLPALEHWPWV